MPWLLEVSCCTLKVGQRSAKHTKNGSVQSHDEDREHQGQCEQRQLEPFRMGFLLVIVDLGISDFLSVDGSLVAATLNFRFFFAHVIRTSRTSHDLRTLCSYAFLDACCISETQNARPYFFVTSLRRRIASHLLRVLPVAKRGQFIYIFPPFAQPRVRWG